MTSVFFINYLVDNGNAYPSLLWNKVHKVMIKVSKVVHRGIEQFKLDFSYEVTVIAQVKNIEGAKWSQTLRAWLIPFTKEALNSLKATGIKLDMSEFSASACSQYIKSAHEQLPPANFENRIEPSERKVENAVSIMVTGRKIVVKMPKNETDIRFINTLKYSRWNRANFVWEIPNYPGNLDLIKDHFQDRIGQIVVNESMAISLNRQAVSVYKDEMLIIKTLSGRLRIISVYNGNLQRLIKKIPYHHWDSKNKWWTTPYSEGIVEQLKEFSSLEGLKIKLEHEESGEQGLKRANSYDILNYKECPESMKLKLLELRYSERTIRTYCSMVEEFINFHYRYELDKITEPQIIEFLRFLVMERKVSTSYQNQAINAIKFYYEKVLGGQRKFYFIDRPKKERTLPTVLNEQEVKALFSCVDNLKHKTMLMLAYSAGLRLGEIIRLKLIDLDRERMQIRISQSKGKKDRYTKLSHKFLKTFDKYLEEYRPKVFVFEGAAGGEYSPTSLQNVIRAAAKRAGIEKHTTMHTLRHAFATHCLENGVDLRYIQSMLGHDSSKTTEVYTHITTRGFDQIKSPLDSLDI